MVLAGTSSLPHWGQMVWPQPISIGCLGHPSHDDAILGKDERRGNQGEREERKGKEARQDEWEESKCAENEIRRENGWNQGRRMK